MDKKIMVRITGWENELVFLHLELGISPDEDSRPNIHEWYWTMTEEDARAAAELFDGILKVSIV